MVVMDDHDHGDSLERNMCIQRGKGGLAPCILTRTARRGAVGDGVTPDDAYSLSALKQVGESASRQAAHHVLVRKGRRASIALGGGPGTDVSSCRAGRRRSPKPRVGRMSKTQRDVSATSTEGPLIPRVPENRKIVYRCARDSAGEPTRFSSPVGWCCDCGWGYDVPSPARNAASAPLYSRIAAGAAGRAE